MSYDSEFDGVLMQIYDKVSEMLLFVLFIYVQLIHMRLQINPVRYRIIQHTCNNNATKQTSYRINIIISKEMFLNNYMCLQNRHTSSH